MNGAAVTLSKLADGPFMTQFFRTRVLAERDAQALRSCEPKVLRKGLRKTLVQYTLRFQGRPPKQEQLVSRTVVGKFRPDGRGAETFRLLQELWQKGFGPEYSLRICEPVGYFPDWNLILTSKAPGVELARVLIAGDDHLVLYIAQAARWLAKVHRTPVACARSYTLAEEEQTLHQWFQHLKVRYPRAAERIRRLTLRLGEEQRSLVRLCHVLIHGDYHLRNVFVDARGATAIDLEQSHLFDPAKDLGYFLAQLTMDTNRHRLSLDIKALRESFLRAYAKERAPETIERVPTYEARSYLQHLHFIYWTLGKKAHPADFERWLGRTEDCLQIGS